MAIHNKETLKAKIDSKYPDIIDVQFVPIKSKTTITYKCGHTDTVILNSLLYQGSKSICKICNPFGNPGKQFLDKVSLLSSDIEFLEEYKGSTVRINFKYKSCGHTNRVSPRALFSRGDGLICRICSPIKKTQETFLSEVNALTSDIEFLEEYINFRTPISFRYKSCGHTNKVIPANLFNRGDGLICRICNPFKIYNSKSNEQFLEEVLALTSDIEFLEEYKSSNVPILFKYKSCNHTHKVSPNNFLGQGVGLICRICNPLTTSKGEREIAELLSKYTEVETSNRSILEGLEIDIYLPELKIGIEYNGEYWHQENKKGKNYHLDKTIAAKKQGIRLIHIFEHEWLQKQDIVKSRLLGMLQQNYKLGARKCIVKELAFNEVKDFLNENHLQGAGSPSKYNLGLLYNDLLVAVMTFSKPRFNSNYDYELIRYCSLIDINIQGGASKLLKYFTSKYQGSIISYSDKRWSIGNLYKTLGFEYSHSSEPSYFYNKDKSILSRYQCQKHKLKELVPEFYKDDLSESDIMANAGYYKVFDCGTDVWIKEQMSELHI